LRTSTRLLGTLAAVSLIIAACAPAATPTPAPQEPTPTPAAEQPTPEPAAFTACMISDVGGIDDKSFNQNAWAGMQMAADKLGIEVRFLESRTAADYERNINLFIGEGCNIIVTVGFLLGDATRVAAEANPDVRFAIVDFAYDPPLPNVEGLVYSTAEAAMLAGYVAASVSQTGILGTFGGINIGAPVTDFMDGFVAGANYFNAQKGANVRVLGWNPITKEGSFTGNFESTDDARALTTPMLDEGADVILPVGGPIGAGAYAALQDTPRLDFGIGVDVDWTVSAPQFTDVLLTSILKRIDNSVAAAIERAYNGEPPKPVFVSTLANEGVGIAPFHQFEDLVTAETRAELEALAAKIIAGEVIVSDWFAAP
jgi:basic membrane protein A